MLFVFWVGEYWMVFRIGYAPTLMAHDFMIMDFSKYRAVLIIAKLKAKFLLFFQEKQKKYVEILDVIPCIIFVNIK